MYTFDASDPKFHPHAAVTLARTKLLEQVSNDGSYNFLVNEGYAPPFLSFSFHRAQTTMLVLVL